MTIKGGNINEDEVHPGVAIYFKGADIGAVVSTGTWSWKVEVQGQRPLSGKLFFAIYIGLVRKYFKRKPKINSGSGLNKWK